MSSAFMFINWKSFLFANKARINNCTPLKKGRDRNVSLPINVCNWASKAVVKGGYSSFRLSSVVCYKRDGSSLGAIHARRDKSHRLLRMIIKILICLTYRLHNQYVINATFTWRRTRHSKRFIGTICMPDEPRINTKGSIARTTRSERVQATLYFKEDLRAIAESAVLYETFIPLRDENLNTF